MLRGQARDTPPRDRPIPSTAVLFDVHGNLPALGAVIADARATGAESFLLGGDYVVFGAFPGETAARLRDLDAVAIRGNTDRWLEDASDAPGSPLVARSLEWCRDTLGRGPAHELASMQATAPLEGGLLCHASPRSDMETFTPDPSEADGALLAESDPEVIVFGHSHLQFIRTAGERLLVNPGSVGLPFDGDRRAAYAIWRGDRDFELRRVEYDASGYAQEIKARMGAALGDSVATLTARVEQAAFVQ